MLKRFKRWYDDTPRQKRYAWGVLISFAIGLVSFCLQLAEGIAWQKAFNAAVVSWFMIPYAVLLVPQFFYDWVKGYEKHRTELDEMEKTVFRRARAASSMAVVFFFIGVLFAAETIYGDGSDIISIPESFFSFVMLGALLVMMLTQSIAYVVLYSRQGNTEDIEDLPEQSGSGMSKD